MQLHDTNCHAHACSKLQFANLRLMSGELTMVLWVTVTLRLRRAACAALRWPSGEPAMISEPTRKSAVLGALIWTKFV